MPLIRSPSRNQCDPDLFLSRARHRATAWLNCSPSGNPYDPDFLFALLRASINPFASREPSLPNFFFRPGENPYDAAIIFGLHPVRRSIFGTRSRSGYTSELASRILPGLRMSSFRALALVKRVFFVFCTCETCVFFVLFLCVFFFFSFFFFAFLSSLRTKYHTPHD